jgi:hypothetical protein
MIFAKRVSVGKPKRRIAVVKNLWRKYSGVNRRRTWQIITFQYDDGKFADFGIVFTSLFSWREARWAVFRRRCSTLMGEILWSSQVNCCGDMLCAAPIAKDVVKVVGAKERKKRGELCRYDRSLFTARPDDITMELSQNKHSPHILRYQP